MMGKVAILFLIWAILATTFAYQQYQEAQSLKKKVVTLKWQIYTNKTLAKSLKSEKESLEKRIKELENENWRLIQQVDKLEKENEELRSKLSNLYVKIAELEEKLKLYEQVPHGYYSTNFFPKYPNTVKGLKNFLAHLKIPHKYERGVFDCSEISAYVEWALENAGFDAYIVLGEVNFYGKPEIHSWNMVKVEGSTYYIDASSGKPYLFKSNPHYIKIIKIFKNIYEAVNYYDSVKEFDWWNVVGFPPKIRR